MTTHEATVEHIAGSLSRQPSVLSVVIPAYNEEAGIGAIVNRVLNARAALAEVGIDDLELIVVDDGSSDRTAQIVEEYPQVRLIRHPVNKGYGAALKTGFGAARGDLLAFLDADGTYPAEYLPQLCVCALEGADLVVGSRRSGSNSEMPLVRRVGNLIWSTLVSLLSNHRVIDPASGMRVFRRAVFECLCPLPDGLNFTPVMSTRAVHEGLRMVEVPISYQERTGASKLSVVRDGTRFLHTIIWTSLAYNPVRLLGGMGMILCAFGGSIGAALIAMRLRGITTLGPWGIASTFLAVVLVFAGVDLLALGSAFNYLVSLFHKKPVGQGFFRSPLFHTALDRHFWWLGAIGVVAGLALNISSLALALGGWSLERLWLYLLAGTMLLLLGVQLAVFWLIMRVLEELSHRDVLVQADMGLS